MGTLTGMLVLAAGVTVLDPGAGASTVRVSVTSDGAEGAGPSDHPATSRSGRYVAFESEAPDLVPNDTNDRNDVFVHDRANRTTVRVSINSIGGQATDGSDDPHISLDGRFVVFESFAKDLVLGDTNGVRDAFVHDRLTGETTRVSISNFGQQGNAGSFEPQISENGRLVVFPSEATNLVLGDDNWQKDIFLRDRWRGWTSRLVERGDDPSISADGDAIAFRSAYPHDPDDWNGVDDVYFLRRSTNTLLRVSAGPGGVDSDDESFHPAISADGSTVVFTSRATNLVSDDHNGVLDVFRCDVTSGTVRRVSVSSTGAEGNGASIDATVSEDGRLVAFTSAADNLVPSDLNDADDVFVFDVVTRRTRRVGIDSSGAPADGDASDVWLSADGLHVVYESCATTLVSDDGNDEEDVFSTGPAITLDAQPETVAAGDLLTLTVWGGAPDAVVALMLLEAGDLPAPLVVHLGRLDEHGATELQQLVPDGWAGTEMSVQAFSRESTRPGCATLASNIESIAIAAARSGR